MMRDIKESAYQMRFISYRLLARVFSPQYFIPDNGTSLNYEAWVSETSGNVCSSRKGLGISTDYRALIPHYSQLLSIYSMVYFLCRQSKQK